MGNRSRGISGAPIQNRIPPLRWGVPPVEARLAALQAAHQQLSPVPPGNHQFLFQRAAQSGSSCGLYGVWFEPVAARPCFSLAGTRTVHVPPLEQMIGSVQIDEAPRCNADGHATGFASKRYCHYSLSVRSVSWRKNQNTAEALEEMQPLSLPFPRPCRPCSEIMNRALANEIA